MRTLSILALIGLILVPAGTQAAVRPPSGPHFRAVGEDRPAETLPLEASTYDVRVTGVIAEVRLTQVYRNRGTVAIHADYVFPASTGAAVHGLTLKVGDRVTEAEIRRRDSARKAFQAARQKGQNAALLEAERPNIFRMRVANVMPGDRVEVELQYTELLVPTEKTYELVIPAVVGPRYRGGEGGREAPDGSSSDLACSPPIDTSGSVPYRFEVRGRLQMPVPLASLSFSDAGVTFERASPTSGRFELGDPEAGRKDFVVRYRLAGDEIISGLLLEEGAEEDHFLLMVQPPEHVELEAIPPREYIFVLDVSGSMSGFPLDVAKFLLRDLVAQLRPSDRFNMLVFAGGSSLMAPESVPATSDQVETALRFLEGLEGGGGTELLSALERAMALPRSGPRARSFVIVTDGYVQVEREAFTYVKAHLGDANFFPFGIGSSVNRHLIEGLARAGRAEPFVVMNEAEAPEAARRFRRYIERPILSKVQAGFTGFEAYDISPGALPDVLADRPIVVLGKWRGPVKGTLEVRGQTGRGPHVERFAMAEAPKSEGRGLSYLWARNRVAELSDEAAGRAEESEAEVTRLGLRYRLLTPFTSFVAVQREIRNPGGTGEEARQPLPLPAGVSEAALPYRSGAEPSLVHLLFLLLPILGLYVRRRRSCG